VLPQPASAMQSTRTNRPRNLTSLRLARVYAAMLVNCGMI
jgi:hypothetical protein